MIRPEEIPEKFSETIGQLEAINIPHQGMTSDTAILRSDEGRFLIKRTSHPQFKAWLRRFASCADRLTQRHT